MATLEMSPSRQVLISKCRPGSIWAKQEAGSFTSMGTYSFAAHFIDIDDDSNVDLAIVSDFGTTMIWWNNGDGRFQRTKEAGVSRVENGMGSTMMYDDEGRLNWFISSIFDPRPPDSTTLSVASGTVSTATSVAGNLKTSPTRKVSQTQCGGGAQHGSTLTMTRKRIYTLQVAW